MNDTAKCEICGEPMPRGEEMFKFHGYSGPCPPFASDVAEKSYQALLAAGAKATRAQFREAIMTFVLEDQKSREEYEKWRLTTKARR